MDAVVQLFKNMNKVKLASLLATIAILFVLFAALMSQFSSSQMVVLFGNLSVEDSNNIVGQLDQKNIPYELRANGTQILVPEDKALRARMDLAKEGMPAQGSIVGYEIFDNADSFNTSNFVQNVHLVRALEGELARTISTFKQIRKARVHLVIPKRELFSREYLKPTASVVLEVGGGSLGKIEVDSIAHLVAAAVPGLSIEDVTIVDTKGRALKLSEEDTDEITSAANKAQDYKAAFEKKLKRTIEKIVEKTVGVGGVDAQISAEVNFDRIVTNSETFDPDGQVVRSIVTIEEKESSSEKGGSADASVANSLPSAQGGGGESSENSTGIHKTDETINYEISRTVKNHILETGTIKRLSIAVLVDGTYSTNAETGEAVYAPRSEEEIKKIESLVKSAVGFDKERKDYLEVINMPFKSNIPKEIPKESLVDWVKGQLQNQLYGLIKTTVISLLVIVVLLFFVRPFVYRIFDAATASIHAQMEAEIAIAQAEVEAASIKADTDRETRAVEIEGPSESIKIKKNPAFKSVNDIAEQAPQETVMILRNWLNS